MRTLFVFIFGGHIIGGLSSKRLLLDPLKLNKRPEHLLVRSFPGCFLTEKRLAGLMRSAWHKNTKVFLHQSEARTAGTVRNWCGKILSRYGLSLLPHRLRLSPRKSKTTTTTSFWFSFKRIGHSPTRNQWIPSPKPHLVAPSGYPDQCGRGLAALGSHDDGLAKTISNQNFKNILKRYPGC